MDALLWLVHDTCWTLGQQQASHCIPNPKHCQITSTWYRALSGTLVPGTILCMIVAEYRTECRMYPSEQFMKQHISVL